MKGYEVGDHVVVWGRDDNGLDLAGTERMETNEGI